MAYNRIILPSLINGLKLLLLRDFLIDIIIATGIIGMEVVKGNLINKLVRGLINNILLNGIIPALINYYLNILADLSTVRLNLKAVLILVTVSSNSLLYYLFN